MALPNVQLPLFTDCFIFIFQYKGANIQLLDLPGIIEGAAQGEIITIKLYNLFFKNLMNMSLKLSASVCDYILCS